MEDGSEVPLVADTVNSVAFFTSPQNTKTAKTECNKKFMAL